MKEGWNRGVKNGKRNKWSHVSCARGISWAVHIG